MDTRLRPTRAGVEGVVKHIVDVDGQLVAMTDSAYLLALQRSLLALIELAKANGLNSENEVRNAKELIRCRVLQCGMAGACNGDGLGRCPLRRSKP